MKICSITLTSRTRQDIIGDAIRSAAPWVDRCLLMVIDEGDDETISRAAHTVAECGAACALSYVNTVQPFHEWRNEGLDVAGRTEADWALILDTDERIHPNGLDIRNFLAELPANVNVVDVQHDSGQYTKPRFIRLPATVRYSNPIHEELLGAKTVLAPLMRFSELLKTPSQQLARAEHILAGLEKQIDAEPENFRWRYYKGATLVQLGRFYDAVSAFEDVCIMCKDPGMLAWAELQIAMCYQHMEELPVAMQAILSGLAYKPDMAELHWLAGQLCAEMDRWQDAIAWERQATLHGGAHVQRSGLCDPRALFDGPYEIMAIAYEALEDHKTANLMRTECAEQQERRINWCQKGE